MLTKVRSLGETVQGQLSTVACGGARAELGVGDDGVLLRAAFPYGSMRCRAAKVVQGSGGPEMRRRRVIERAGKNSPERGPAKSRRSTGLGPRQRPQEDC